LSNKSFAPLFVLIGAILWGTTGTAQSFAPEGASPGAIGAIRLAIGGLALLLLAIIRGSYRSQEKWPKLIVVLATVSMAAYQPFFFAAVAKTGVAVGTVVTIGSVPVLTGILGFFFKKERPGKRWAVATMLAIVGCIFLFAKGGSISLQPLGVILALLAGLAYATYAISSKELLQNHPPDAVIATTCCLSAVLLSPLLFVNGLGWLETPRGLAVGLYLGLIASALAYMIYATGLASIPVATAVTLSLAEPLTAALLGILVLDERFTFYTLFGVVSLLMGLLLLSLKPSSIKFRSVV